MKKIGLLSDTHGFLDEAIFSFFANCDEIWHAGDIGNLETLDKLAGFKPLRAVFGNIDGQDVRGACRLTARFTCEGVDVLMVHIGGYPGRYDPRIKRILEVRPPKLFISGHSHILKVMYDKKYQLLHINPGAAGHSGLHKHITMVRFNLSEGNITDLEVYERERKQKLC